MSLSILEKPTIRRQVAPLSVAAYHRLRDWGAVGIKTEFIEGLVIEKVTKSPLHEYIIEVIQEFLAQTCPKGYRTRKEGPLTLSDSEPEPDISVVKGSPRDFRRQHPSSAELVVEVAVSSLELDREKAPIYARAGIPSYWLVKPTAKQVDVYGQPRDGQYTRLNVLKETDRLLTWYGAELALSELFDQDY